MLDRRFGLADGFDVYDDNVARDPSGAPRLEAERRGDKVADAALAWLKQDPNTPFCAWIHLYDPHAPYDPPADYLATANGNAYNGEVMFADAQVGRILEWLRTSGVDRTPRSSSLATTARALAITVNRRTGCSRMMPRCGCRW